MIYRPKSIIYIVFIISIFIVFNSCAKIILNSKMKVKNDFTNLKQACDLFYKKYNRYPTKEENLKVLIEFIDNKKNLNDPWGNPYIYLHPGPSGYSYGIYSIGPDGINGNDDDLKSWELK